MGNDTKDQVMEYIQGHHRPDPKMEQHDRIRECVDEFYSKSLNVVIVGGTGAIGTELANHLRPHYVTKAGRKDIDLMNPASIEKFVENTPIDVLINLSVRSIDGFLHKQKKEDILTQMLTNCVGHVDLLRHTLKKMRGQNFGRVIYASSVLSQRPMVGAAIYGACKSFGESLIRSAALENANKGITCNSIVMGYFDRGLCERLPEKLRQDVLDKIPVKRFGTVQELANVVNLYINTPYLNGQSLVIDGGILLT